MATPQTLAREPRARSRECSARRKITLTPRQALAHLQRIDGVDLSNGALQELRRAAVAVTRDQSYTLSAGVVRQVGDSLQWAPQRDGDDNQTEAAAMTVAVAVGIAIGAIVVGIAIGYMAGDVGEGDKGSTITVTNEGDGSVVINEGGGGDDDEE